MPTHHNPPNQSLQRTGKKPPAADLKRSAPGGTQMGDQQAPQTTAGPIHSQKGEQLIALCKGGPYVPHAFVLTDKRLIVVRLKSSEQHRVSGTDHIIGMRAMQKIEANTVPSYARVTQMVNAQRFDELGEDFVTDQISAQDARNRVILLEDDRKWVSMSLQFKTETPNLHGGPFPREFGEELLARLELWTGEKLQFWRPRWWQGGSPGWCFGSSDMDAKRKSINASSMWCRECTRCGQIRRTKEPQCAKCGGTHFV